ncbi:hypothetical protein HAX54_003033, partial [Datura stramonium]|nr:hypothetical protein [Datura stramonium]
PLSHRPCQCRVVISVLHTSWRWKEAASCLPLRRTCYRAARVYASTLGCLAPAPSENCCFFACAMALEWSCYAPAAALGQGCLVRLVPSSCSCSLQALFFALFIPTSLHLINKP